MSFSINWSNRLNVLHAILTGQDKNCPYCKSKNTNYYGKNATLSHIRKCEECQLIYRWPKQDSEFNNRFYQEAYSKIHHSAATDLPFPEELKSLKENGFKGAKRDFSHFTNLFQALNLSVVLDYGSSWGYGTFQFKQGGLKALGYEVSFPRAEFGRKHLDVDILEELDSVKEKGVFFDGIFSSHVLEHLPTPEIALNDFSILLRTGGWLVVTVPNCEGNKARKLGPQWGPYSSSIHPLSLTADFFKFALPRHGFPSPLFFSSPYNREILIRFVNEKYSQEQLAGDELLIVAQKSL